MEVSFKTLITLKNILILKKFICFIVIHGKSCQKGKVEKNHELIRYVLPKGTSFDDLTQSDINTLMSNINSYPREELNKCCPFNLANMLIGKNILHKFGYHEINGNDVVLTPNLFKK